ncbi:hypothetical protein Bhyg_03538, partial [Pseudolycoriella hygida]
MIVTASRIPVPLPMAPMKSANTDNAPIHKPPNAAAVGMYRFNSWIIEFSRCPRITMCCSFNCLATWTTELPETSIHVFEKNAHDPSMKIMYNKAWMGSCSMCPTLSGGD